MVPIVHIRPQSDPLQPTDRLEFVKITNDVSFSLLSLFYNDIVAIVIMTEELLIQSDYCIATWKGGEISRNTTGRISPNSLQKELTHRLCG